MLYYDAIFFASGFLEMGKQKLKKGGHSIGGNMNSVSKFVCSVYFEKQKNISEQCFPFLNEENAHLVLL